MANNSFNIIFTNIRFLKYHITPNKAVLLKLNRHTIGTSSTVTDTTAQKMKKCNIPSYAISTNPLFLLSQKYFGAT